MQEEVWGLKERFWVQGLLAPGRRCSFGGSGGGFGGSGDGFGVRTGWGGGALAQGWSHLGAQVGFRGAEGKFCGPAGRFWGTRVAGARSFGAQVGGAGGRPRAPLLVLHQDPAQQVLGTGQGHPWLQLQHPKSHGGPPTFQPPKSSHVPPNPAKPTQP